ncbi:hypothetical protein VPH35_050815 [Triticum aestivum]
MARKKVTLQYIPNDSTLRGTFKKRRRGMMKKANELAIPCDGRACVLVYGKGEMVPEGFPSHVEAVKILKIFKNMPELEHIDKLRDQLRNFGRECRDREIKTLLHMAMCGNLPGLIGLNIEELDHQRGLEGGNMTGNMDMGSPAVYQSPPTQESWLDMVRSGGDLVALVCSGYSGSHDAASIISSAGYSGGDAMQPFDLGFGWHWGADLGASSSPFPPM